ncbi:MAG: alpha-L-glutamate ligase-like protein [Pseudomonadales bacterium]
MNWISPLRLRKLGILGMNRRNVEFISPYNQRRHFPLVDDKLLTKKLAEEHGIAVPKLIDVVETQYGIQSIGEKLDKLTAFVAKPANGSGGKGILVIKDRVEGRFLKASGALITLEDVQRHLTNTISGLHSLGGRPDVAFLEELVTVDERFTRISFEGVPDIRLIVFKGVPVMGMLRLATKSSDGKANLHQGAIGVGLDIGTGAAVRAVQREKLVLQHPDTGALLNEIQIPEWDNLLALAAECYDATHLGYLGCDIVLDQTHGPLILELNARSGLSIQIANNRGMLPRLRHLRAVNTRKMSVSDRVAYAKEEIAAL